MRMVEIRLGALRAWMEAVLTRVGMTPENTATVADVVMRATLRGMGHHDIYDFPAHLQALLNGSAVANPEYRRIAEFQTMESWDGGDGLGELVCSFAIERAMRKADRHGIGFCTVRNSNHFLSAAPYVERASEAGYIALLLAKGAPTMGAPERTEEVIGTLPMGYAFPTDRGIPVVFDACMAYASFGALKARIERGETVPVHWGLDERGAPTTDPGELMRGTRWPIGSHKGFALAMLGEVLTALLSDGCIVDEVPPAEERRSTVSHAAVAIRPDGLMEQERFRKRADEMLERMEVRAPGLRFPGENSERKRREFLARDAIELREGLLDELDLLCERVGAEKLSR